MNVNSQITEWVKNRKLAGGSFKFKERQIAVIDGLIPSALFDEMRREADALLKTEARRRELTIKESGNTPRAYTSVGRDAIAQGSKATGTGSLYLGWPRPRRRNQPAQPVL